jgi:trehalose-6-phosphate synthase
MPDEERERRWGRLVSEVETNTATAWADSFLRDLAES